MEIVILVPVVYRGPRAGARARKMRFSTWLRKWSSANKVLIWKLSFWRPLCIGAHGRSRELEKWDFRLAGSLRSRPPSHEPPKIFTNRFPRHQIPYRFFEASKIRFSTCLRKWSSANKVLIWKLSFWRPSCIGVHGRAPELEKWDFRLGSKSGPPLIRF